MNSFSALPQVIAHRGASGYLPEHTREAKVLAFGFGADFLEQDVIAARDGTLVVSHDLHLDDISDVAARFPGRARNDGRHYVIDFDWPELSTLRVFERRRPGTSLPVFPGRFDDASITFRLTRLDDELRLVRALNRSSGRNVGVYPEIKDPAFHHRHGVDLTAALLATLEVHGYSDARSGAVVQCFDPKELQRCRDDFRSRLPLAQLVEAGRLGELDDARLARVADYAETLAPHYEDLLAATPAGQQARPAAVVQALRSAGLALHPYTFRQDRPTAPFADFAALLEYFFAEIRVEAVFCDQPDVAVRVRDGLARAPG